MNIKLKMAIIIAVVAGLCMQSCSKAKQLEGSTWSGNCDIILDQMLTFSGPVTLSFTADKNVAVIAILSDPGYGTLTARGMASFSSVGKKIFLDVKWATITHENTGEYYLDDYKWWNQKLEDIDTGKWSGTMNKTSMTLESVFGKTVTFNKR